jgi:hypothetical protein
LQDRGSLPNSLFFFEQLSQILAIEKEKLSYDPTPEEVRAGISRFGKFKEFGTIYTLSKSLNKDYEEVLQMDYNTVFLTLWYEREQSEYQRSLNKVMSQKK